MKSRIVGEDMIRKNNKGFAVTTLIYGLSIMGILIVSILMATIASERNNNTDLAKSIEQELKNVTNAEKNFQPVLDSGGLPAAQEYVVVDDGYYLIELWGCQGSGNGGYGAYTSGLIYLQKGETLYFYVGNHKTTGGEGGKATDVRILGGNYAFGDRSDTDSANTRIMTAAGGGSSSLSSGGTLYGYNSSMNPLGGTINTTTYQLDSTTLFGFNDYSRSSLSQSVVTSVVGSNGGGDGYYSSNNSEIGGTSYISGYGGVVTIMRNGTQATSSDATRYMYQELDYNENTGATTYNNVKPYVFLGGRMYGGVNEGDGKAKISRVSYTSSEDDLRQSSNFKNVTAVRDCVSTAGNGSSVQKVKFSVIAAGADIGKDVATGAIENVTSGCATLTLSKSYDLEEIATWHLDNDNNYLDGRDFPNHTISVLIGGSWKDVKKSTTLSETETVAGNHVSAYQTGFDKLKSGVYYIIRNSPIIFLLVDFFEYS